MNGLHLMRHRAALTAYEDALAAGLSEPEAAEAAHSAAQDVDDERGDHLYQQRREDRHG
jgi:hypothetical protein